MKSTALLPLLFALPLLLSACKTTSVGAGSKAKVIDLGPVAAADLLNAGEAKVFDVRTPAEYTGVRIKGAVLADIREDGFEEKVAALDQKTPYIVHCAAGVDGGRSRKAVEALAAAGATRIYHLDGGINAWVAEGLPVETGE